MPKQKILIVDNGGQYVHRIWRSLRELDVESEIVKPADVEAKLKTEDPMGLILSGGPTSVYEDNLGHSKEILNIKMPILGICWGHQFIAHSLGGKVKYGDKGEYGHSEITVDDEDQILKGMPEKFQAWVSHRDEVVELPPGFVSLAHSQTCKIEAMRHKTKPIFGVQFHPEVFHTQNGKLVLQNFIDACDGR
jgi:GMP synthase (glutamine-hydrolysing)